MNNRGSGMTALYRFTDGEVSGIDSLDWVGWSRKLPKTEGPQTDRTSEFR